MSREIICFGETLWDLLPSGKMPGGAPMNVAVHLAQLGRRSAIISRVGEDELGHELEVFLKSKDVPLDYLQTDPAFPTGVVQVDVSSSTEVKYEIVSPAAWDSISLEQKTVEAVKKAQAFVYGTLAAREWTTRQTLFQLLEHAPYKVLDVNFRAPFYQQQSTEALLRQAHLVKMNHHELEEIAGWYGRRGTQKENMRFLRQKFNVEVLVVTRGENGAILLQNNIFTEHPGFCVTVTDTIGSGDAFLAAFLARFLADGDVASALHSACLLGALVATYPGATPSITPAERLRFEQQHPRG